MVTADPAVRDQWGTIWDGTVAVVEQAITGNSPINIAGLTNYPLSVANNAPDQARQFVYNFVGAISSPCNVQLPAVPKFGLASNNTTGGQLVAIGTGLGRYITVAPGQSTWFTCDGANVDAPVLTGATPIGGLMQFAGSVAPARWLMCFGQPISRTTYALLFAVVGTTFGAGDGSTTFNLPDLRGRTMVGLDNMGGTAAGRATAASGTPGTTLGGVGGSETLQYHGHGINDPTHTHSITDPTHTHSIYDPGHLHAVSDPSHVHTFNDPGHAHGVYDPGHNHTIHDPGHIHGVGDPGHGHSAWTDTQGSHNHSVNAWGVSGGPNAVAPGVIATGNTIWTSTDGSHGHNVGIGASGTGVYLGYSATGLYHDAAATGIGIYGAGTGGYNSYAYTGISVTAHVTGVATYGAGTGVSNQYSATGITVSGTGSGGSQNMPPLMMVNTIIYCGV